MNPITCKRVMPGSVRAIAALSFVILSAAGIGQEKPDRRSPPAALNLYADAASFQNNGEFDLASDEWEKFLKQFPSDPLTDKARHYAGVCRLQMKQYEKAATHFAAAASKGEDFEFAEDAHLNLGWCQYSLGGQGKADMYAKAAESFANIVKLFPKGKYADQALLYQGESLYALDKKPDAIKAYRQLVDQHAKSPLRPDGLYVLGVTHEELGQFKEAGAVYDIFIKECSENALILEVRMRKAETILQAGQFAEAEKGFAEVAGVAGFEAADHALLRQAFCAAKQDKYDVAAQLYARIPAEFPDSANLAEATMSAGRCFFRSGDFPKAASWLQRAVDAGGPDLAEAAHWLCRIHLQQNAADKVAELADRVLPKAGESDFLVNLKMDQADALNALSEWKAESVTKYLQIATAHGDHKLAPQAMYNAAFACWELGQFKDGLQHADDFLKKYKDDTLAADVKHVRAECHLKLSDYPAAETAYRDLVDHHADVDRILQWKIRLALVLHLQKKYADAVQWLNSFLPELKDENQIAEARFLLGICHFHQNQFAEAEKAFADSLAAASKWRQADETLLFLARVQHKNNRLAEAVKTVRQMIADFPKSELLDQAHYRLGEFHYAATDFQAAADAYSVVIAKWPNSAFAPFAQYGQGWSLLKGKKFAPAVESFGGLIGRHAQHQLVPDAHFGRAMCQRQLGEYQKAVDDIAAYLKSTPANNRADALHERALSEVALRKFADAAQTFEILLKEDPKYRSAANILYELAFSYRELGEEDQAVATFARLAQEHGQSPLAAEAHWRVGEAHFEKNEFEKAAEQYTQAKAKSSSGEVNELATHKLGWSQFRLEKYDAALEQFRAQIKEYPAGAVHADGLFLQAECLYQLKQYEQALPVFSAASQTKPSNSQMQALTLLHGGQCAAEMQQWEESLRFLDQIPDKFPKTPHLADALGKRGWAKQNLGRLDEAMVDYEQAVASSREEAGAYAQCMIGEIQFERKQHEEAVRSFLRVMYGYGGENAVKEVKHWQAMAGFEAGRCAEVQKKIDNAKKYYAFVVQRFGEHELAAKSKERLDALNKL